MAALSVQVPYPVFYDRDGQPIDNGNIYIGIANLDPVTNPLQVYYDDALTITASQPLVTSNGYIYRNGTPTQLYVNATDFSITVNDSKNLLVYSFPEATGVGVGASSIEYNPPFAGALTSGYTVQDKLSQTVSVMDFGAVGDGVTNDTPAIQDAVDALEALGDPFTLVFPAGYTFLLQNPVRVSADNVRLTGGGTIHTQSSSFTTALLIPGLSSDIRAGFIFWNGTTVRTTSLSTPTYDSEMQSGITVDNLTFYDDYNQSSSPLSVFSCSMVLAYCINVSVNNNTFYGYKGEIIKGVTKNFNISNNSFRDSFIMAISLFDYNGVISGNNCYKIGEFYEGSGDRIVVSNNVGDYCGTVMGTTPTTYLISLGGRSGNVTQAVISNNVFTNSNVTQGFGVLALVANYTLDLQITDNYIEGNLKDQAFIYVFTAAADGGSVLVSGNTLIESASNPYTNGGIIVFDNNFASSVFPAYMCVDNQVVIQSTAKTRTAISSVNIQNGIIQNNSIKLLGTLASGVVGYALANNTIWISTTSSNSAFGYEKVVAKDNYINGTICGDDTVRVTALAAGNVLDTKGREYVEMTNAGALSVDEVYTAIGKTVTVHVTSGAVTFNNGTYFKTSTGANEVVSAGKIYRFTAYNFGAGTTERVICKALSAPVTI